MKVYSGWRVAPVVGTDRPSRFSPTAGSPVGAARRKVGESVHPLEGYPPEVVAEIARVLEWIEAHPRGEWSDMGDLFALYKKWRDIIRGTPPLLDGMGTSHTVDGLSSFGRILLLRHRAEPHTPPTIVSKVPPDAEGELPPDPSKEPSPPLTPEDAAILKVLLQANGVTKTVDRIMEMVSLSDRTIRTRLKYLRELKLVHEPVKKKGYCLTAMGLDRAGKLPADAGADLFKPGH